MSRLFGWDLPPGCTIGDIERQAGDDFSYIDAYSEQPDLTQGLRTILDRLCEDSCFITLAEDLAQFAFDLGYKQAHDDAEEQAYWEQQRAHDEAEDERLEAAELAGLASDSAAADEALERWEAEHE